MMARSQLVVILAAFTLLLCRSSVAFVPPSPFLARPAFALRSEPASPDPDSESTSSATSATSISPEAQARLAEKMKSWEATEEDIKKATLGGMVPKTDGFNITLWILFVPIVGFSLLFAIFPFIMDGIDTSEFGPPPSV